MDNINEEPNAINKADPGVANEEAKREWEEKMAKFKEWFVSVRHMFSETLGDFEYAKMWNKLVFDFFHQMIEETGLDNLAIRRYGIIHIIIDSTVAYESAPNFDLPDGKIENLFRKVIAEKQVEVGEGGLK